MADNNSSVNEDEDRFDSRDEGAHEEEEEPSLFGDNAD